MMSKRPNPGALPDMLTLDALTSRVSTACQRLLEPGPDLAQLERMLTVAMHVPDHGRLAPWRFIVVRDSARQPLADFLASRARQREPDATDAALNKVPTRFAQSPCVVVVVAQIQAGHKVPESEQWLSGGAVCLSLLQAAHALGFGAQWLTGWAAYDPPVLAHLGLAAHERVLGFIHIGRIEEPAPERTRPALNERLQMWQP